MTIVWWHWLAFGLLLVALEMASAGGFYVVFFGVAAIAISMLRVVDMAGPLWFQFMLFAALSVGSLVAFRNPLLRWLSLDRGGGEVDSLIGDLAVPLEEIAPGAVGRAELRGAVWSSRNRGTRALIRGERCRVVKVDELMIFIEPEGAR